VESLRAAVAAVPGLARAWQRLGEALLGDDRSAAEHALTQAFEAARLPLAYPGEPGADSSVVGVLEHLQGGAAAWRDGLSRFLAERVSDLRTPACAALYEAASLALGRSFLAQGDRSGARSALLQARDRLAGFTHRADLPRLQLALVTLETDLGHHDEAEDTLRRLRRHEDAGVRARAALALGRIALLREEPWVEEIVREALSGPLPMEQRCEAWLLLAEHAPARRALESAPLAPTPLEEAAKLARQLGDPALQARVTLLEGDSARAGGDLARARQVWSEACDADAETALRALVRLGDLEEDPRVAEGTYRRAVAGYRALELPLREAWARLRLVRCGDVAQAEEARGIFKATNLAAGVAAADVLVGKPGHSLSWHLNLGAELARQRHDAQRMRAPLTRAEADRPERRLLSHRRAIAGCDGRIVQALAEEIRGELGRIAAGDGRPRDPAVMRFIAAVDLLAGHPGYDAARVMMQLLVSEIPSETASRALMGALARSPNMTLVEALLAAARSLTEPRALASAVEALGWRREQEAAPRLRELAANGSSPVRRAAITALGRIGDEDAIDGILPALEVPELAEAASVALLLLGEWKGVDFHGQALAQDRPHLARSPGEIVGRHGGPSYLLLLLRLAEREGAAGLGAIQGLGLLGSVRAVPRLVELCGSREQGRSLAAQTALELITGRRADVEDPYPRQTWEQWWAANAERFDERKRWRSGRALDLPALAERLGDDDVAVRLSSYDELVIATGERLPFDADGPWRMQVAHRSAWTRWLEAHAEELPETSWAFFGRGIG
jgi:HEAT repeat protein